MIRTADLEIDLKHHTVRKGGVLLALLESEWRILTILAGNAGRAVRLEEIQGAAGMTKTSLRMRLAALRRRLEADPNQPTIIVTVPRGYQFRVLPLANDCGFSEPEAPAVQAQRMREAEEQWWLATIEQLERRRRRGNVREKKDAINAAGIYLTTYSAMVDELGRRLLDPQIPSEEQTVVEQQRARFEERIRRLQTLLP